MGFIHAERALALVDTPFRAQGRDPTIGLDCIGLALNVFELPLHRVRRNYRLRGDHKAEMVKGLCGFFRRVSRKQARTGDLLLLAVAADQLHVAVLTARGFVHADAGLRRVVETPGEPQWPIAGFYRRRRTPPPSCGWSPSPGNPGEERKR